MSERNERERDPHEGEGPTAGAGSQEDLGGDTAGGDEVTGGGSQAKLSDLPAEEEAARRDGIQAPGSQGPTGGARE